MSSFALLFGKILESSLWVTGTKDVRILWITMLAMKNKDGVVSGSLIGLADRAKLKRQECEVALLVLMSPDPEDTSGVEKGVRVKELPGRGWQIVNHDKYRFSEEARRAIWRETKAIQRQEQKDAEPTKQEIEESKAYKEVHTKEPIESATTEPARVPATYVRPFPTQNPRPKAPPHPPFPEQ